MNRHEVAAHDGKAVIVNRKNERCVHGSVDQTQKIFFALEVVVGKLKESKGGSLPSRRLDYTLNHHSHRLRNYLGHCEKGVLQSTPVTTYRDR